jgi:hypothetical protein
MREPEPAERHYRDFVAIADNARLIGWIDHIGDPTRRESPPPGFPGGLSYGFGKLFEFIILRGFQIEVGYANISWPYTIHFDELFGTPREVDATARTFEQIDGSVHCDGLTAIIECKASKDASDFGEFAKLQGHLARRPAAAIGMFFALGGVTDSVRLAARLNAKQPILVWDRREIEEGLAAGDLSARMMRKYRMAAEIGKPDWSTVED